MALILANQTEIRKCGNSLNNNFQIRESRTTNNTTRIFGKSRITRQPGHPRANGQDHKKAHVSSNNLTHFSPPSFNFIIASPDAEVLKSHDNLHDFRHTLCGKSCQLRAITTSTPNWNQRNSHTRTHQRDPQVTYQSTRTKRPRKRAATQNRGNYHTGPFHNAPTIEPIGHDETPTPVKKHTVTSRNLTQ